MDEHLASCRRISGRPREVVQGDLMEAPRAQDGQTFDIHARPRRVSGAGAFVPMVELSWCPPGAAVESRILAFRGFSVERDVEGGEDPLRTMQRQLQRWR